MTTKYINYAVQRQNPDLEDWDTIRGSITSHRSSAYATAADPAHALSVSAR
jgi:hypothetical protein